VTAATEPEQGHDVAFVLGGGGVLGASEVGMLRGLFDAGIRPDLVVGTSVGALNGAVVAHDPNSHSVEKLTDVWMSTASTVWAVSPLDRVMSVARTRTALHSIEPLRDILTEHLGDARIEDLPVPYHCCAASIERASEHWFTNGSVVDAVLASCSVPGLFPAYELDGEHFVDGGIVNSIPVGRAVELGARTIYVLQVGRIERNLTAPTTPWEVGLVAFEIARRHRFARDMAAVPDDITVHLLPSGEDIAPLATLRYRDTKSVTRRIEQSEQATVSYLEQIG
jgi:NTE family protein